MPRRTQTITTLAAFLVAIVGGAAMAANLGLLSGEPSNVGHLEVKADNVRSTSGDSASTGLVLSPRSTPTTLGDSPANGDGPVLVVDLPSPAAIENQALPESTTTSPTPASSAPTTEATTSSSIPDETTLAPAKAEGSIGVGSGQETPTSKGGDDSKGPASQDELDHEPWWFERSPRDWWWGDGDSRSSSGDGLDD